MKKASIMLSLVLVSIFSVSLFAHDMWIQGKPELFLNKPGQVTLAITVGGVFPVPEFPVTKDRIARFLLIQHDGNRETLEWDVLEKESRATIELKSPGHAYVFVEQKPRYIELTADQFNEYVQHEGMPHIYHLRKDKGILDEPARELYTRYVKALIHVEPIGDNDNFFTQPLNTKIEFIPLKDPCHGGSVPFKLLLDGKPLADQVIQYGTDSKAIREVKTNAQGEATLDINQEGLWIVKTIHMEYHPKEVSFEGKKVNWVSHWATLTFQVRKSD